MIICLCLLLHICFATHMFCSIYLFSLVLFYQYILLHTCFAPHMFCSIHLSLPHKYIRCVFCYLTNTCRCMFCYIYEHAPTHEPGVRITTPHRGAFATTQSDENQ